MVRLRCALLRSGKLARERRWGWRMNLDFKLKPRRTAAGILIDAGTEKPKVTNARFPNFAGEREVGMPDKWRHRDLMTWLTYNRRNAP
jgi:hypothetical protein